jgi:SOS-response transcriptional repressor LexA
MMMSNSWNKERIEIAFHNFYNENGRTPTTTEMRAQNGLPSWKHTQKIFGITKVDEFYELIGLTRSDVVGWNKISEETLKNECIRSHNLELYFKGNFL